MSTRNIVRCPVSISKSLISYICLNSLTNTVVISVRFYERPPLRFSMFVFLMVSAIYIGMRHNYYDKKNGQSLPSLISGRHFQPLKRSANDMFKLYIE